MGGISEDLLTARPPAAARLDHMSIADWLTQARVAEPMASLLALAYTEEYGLDPDQNSALNLVLSLGPDNTRFDITGGDDERFKAIGGNGRFIAALARGLQLGPAARWTHRLEAVTSLPNVGATASIARPRMAGERFIADHVVLALPFTMLRQVRLAVDLPERQRGDISQLGYCTNTKLRAGTAAIFNRFLARAGPAAAISSPSVPFNPPGTPAGCGPARMACSPPSAADRPRKAWPRALHGGACPALRQRPRGHLPTRRRDRRQRPGANRMGGPAIRARELRRLPARSVLGHGGQRRTAQRQPCTSAASTPRRHASRATWGARPPRSGADVGIAIAREAVQGLSAPASLGVEGAGAPAPRAGGADPRLGRGPLLQAG